MEGKKWVQSIFQPALPGSHTQTEENKKKDHSPLRLGSSPLGKRQQVLSVDSHYWPTKSFLILPSLASGIRDSMLAWRRILFRHLGDIESCSDGRKSHRSRFMKTIGRKVARKYKTRHKRILWQRIAQVDSCIKDTVFGWLSNGDGWANPFLTTLFFADTSQWKRYIAGFIHKHTKDLWRQMKRKGGISSKKLKETLRHSWVRWLKL